MKLSLKRDGLLNFSDYKKKRHKVAYYVFMFLLIIFALTALIPILWLFITSFKTVTEIQSINYSLFPQTFKLSKMLDVWNKLSFGKYYINTLIVVVGSVICAVIFNAILAYAVIILKPFGYKLINVLILFGYMIPSALAIFPLVMQIRNFLGLDISLINTYFPLWFSFGANAYYYLLFKDYFEKLPKSLVEAARVDGLSDLKIFFNVVFPLSKPIMGVVAIFAMTASYSDFLLPYVVLQDTKMQTAMVAIYNLGTTNTVDSSEFLMLLVISIIPQLILFMIFQKQIMNQSVNSGMKD